MSISGSLSEVINLQGQELKRFASLLASSLHEEDQDTVIGILRQLEKLPMTLEMLQISGLGRIVNGQRLRKSVHQDISHLSRALVERWRLLLHSTESYPDCDSRQAQGNNVQSACATQLESLIWNDVFACMNQSESGGFRSAKREYLRRVRCFTGMLRRSDKAELRSRLLEGSLPLQEFMRMPQEDFLSAEQIALRKKEQLESLNAVVIKGSMFTCFSERLVCPMCSTVGARYSTPGSEE